MAVDAVAYARYSSDGQRDESIDAQVRAIKSFAEREGYALIHVYADRGISGTSDNREEFQRMIEDAKNGDFQVVIVHKLDRFARNRSDSAIYRNVLEKYGVRLVSVLENFDDSPESIILQSVIEGYNEYYSKNLAREVMKGLKENALASKFNGGVPPLGYDINKETLKYEINDFEAEAVKLIFKMYLQGEGYTSIINELNRRGFKTKKANSFGKNSLYDILRNERYTGAYIYNKSLPVTSDKKFNRHASKNAEDIIKVEGGIPQIISKEDFEKVQQSMNRRRHKAAAYKSKEEYLLSGKIICGECGSTYAGNARRSKNYTYISYTCTKKNGKEKCRNRGTQRDLIESIILNKLSEKVFDVKILPEIISRYNDFALSKNKEFIAVKKQLEQRLAEIDKGIANIVNLVVTTGSAALAEKLKELELEKVTLEISLKEAERKLSEMSVDEAQLSQAFSKAKSLLKSGTLKNRKAIVQQYVKQVVMYPDKVEIEFNVIGDTYTIKESFPR
ncbi:MAG: recombinase family protein [Acutalibacteraceae bacterium]|nr:recombinase family protein [Acutalibacteraceae bacterium]